MVLLHVVLSARPRPQPPFALVKGNEGGERKKPLEGVSVVLRKERRKKSVVVVVVSFFVR